MDDAEAGFCRLGAGRFGLHRRAEHGVFAKAKVRAGYIIAPGLYAICEAVDVTGCLVSYNSQWASARGHAAGVNSAGKS